MTTIIAGYLPLQQDIDHAREALIDDGFAAGRISSFYVNPAGQHDLYPLGGDREKSPGAKETPQSVAAGVSAGGAIGAVVGAATVPLTGPAGPIVGALVGAHVGSLYSFSDLKEAGQPEGGKENADGAASGQDNQRRQRHAGMLIAVALTGDGERERAVSLLRRLGVSDLETADGTISDGDWIDFDPLSVPLLVH
jgi:hypothetical protein